MKRTTLILTVCASFVISCEKPDGEACIITVASEQLLDEVSQSNLEIFADVYAVRVGESDEWIPVNEIEGFEYEEGYEYRLRVNSMPSEDNPSVNVLEVVSKEEKTSEDLPKSFIDTFAPIEVSCFVDADDKDTIERDLLRNPDIPWDCHYSFTEGMSQWLLADASQKPLMYGDLVRTTAEGSEMPEVFKMFPLEEQIVSTMKFVFIQDSGGGENGREYDAFIGYPTKSQPSVRYQIWFYEDMTEHYKAKYQEADVRAVIVRHTFRILVK